MPSPRSGTSHTSMTLPPTIVTPPAGAGCSPSANTRGCGRRSDRQPTTPHTPCSRSPKQTRPTDASVRPAGSGRRHTCRSRSHHDMSASLVPPFGGSHQPRSIWSTPASSDALLIGLNFMSLSHSTPRSSASRVKHAKHTRLLCWLWWSDAAHTESGTQKSTRHTSWQSEQI